MIFMITLPVPVAQVQAAPGSADFSIEPSAMNVLQGEVFTINIKVEANGQPVDGVQAYINFDPNYLRVVDTGGDETNQITNGELFDATWPDVLTNAANNSTGQIDYAAGKGIGGSSANTLFTLATIRFKAITQTDNATAIVFNTSTPRATKAVYGLDTVTGAVTNGTIIIGVAPLVPGTTPPAGGGGEPLVEEEETAPTVEEIMGGTAKETAEASEEVAPEPFTGVEEVGSGKTEDIVGEVAPEPALDIIETVSPESAPDIIEVVGPEPAPDIVEEVTTEEAVTVNGWFIGGAVAGVMVIGVVISLVIRRMVSSGVNL